MKEFEVIELKVGAGEMLVLETDAIPSLATEWRYTNSRYVVFAATAKFDVLLVVLPLLVVVTLASGAAPHMFVDDIPVPHVLFEALLLVSPP